MTAQQRVLAGLPGEVVRGVRVPVNQLGGRRAEKALRRAWRKRVEEVHSDVALALGRPLGIETPRVAGASRPADTEPMEATVPVATSTESQFAPKELLPKAFVKVSISKVGEVMPSKFAKSNGAPGDDVFYVTFRISGGKLDGKEFDGQYPNNFGKSVDAAGNQKWISPTRELVEAFLARSIEGEYWEPHATDESEFDIDAEICQTGLLCQGTLIQQANKDGTKTYNKLTNPMPIEDEAPASSFEAVAQDNGYRVQNGGVQRAPQQAANRR